MPHLLNHSRRVEKPHVYWKKDGVSRTLRELCPIVAQAWEGPGKVKGVCLRIEELLPKISKIVLGYPWTLEEVRDHIRRTQHGREFTLNALYQRADKLPRYDEFTSWREYVLQAYCQITGGNVRENFEEWMLSKRMEECHERCEYRGCDLKITGYVSDHFVPVARGGDGSYSNLRIACPRCNSEKSAMAPEDFIEKIQQERKRARKL
jgi:5-methylcytosine-specific restriction endonuclease McrA